MWQVDPTVVPLRVSLNAQQYVEVPQGFRYQGVPTITLLSPTTGPTLGGAPPVRLSGGGRHTLGGLAGGPHYRCRFGNGTGGGYGVYGVHGMYGEYLDVPASHGHENNPYGLQVPL